jgi:hypothetical protein
MGRISGNKGVRPQCERVLPSYVKPESDSRGKKVAKCKMLLQADGTCPDHGKKIN